MTRTATNVWGVATCLGIATLGLVACATGERPTIGEAPTRVGTMTGDPNVDGVLERLDRVDNAVFGADYSAVISRTGDSTAVSAAQTSPTRHSVTIGDYRFLTEDGSSRTCNIRSGACEEGILAQRVSDTGVTPDMIFGDLAKRLRVDSTANVGVSTTFPKTMAGQAVTCVDVQLAGGTSEYCALDNGVAARYVGADATLDLVSYVTVPDESQFLTMLDG